MKDIMITAEDIRIPAVLNDTVAAKDFEKRMPFKAVCHDSGIDYCGSAAIGYFNPLETQAGWKNGDISIAGGWFTILYGDEEHSKKYKDLMVIAHIDEEYLPLVHKLPETIHVKVDYQKDSSIQNNKE